jgi:polysaccharide biosynthesis protein PslE
MQDTDKPVTVRELITAMRRHCGKAFAFFFFSVAASLAYVIWAPRAYESTAGLYVRLGRESVTLDPTATTGATVQFYQTRESEINSILQVVESREIAGKVVDSVGTEPILRGTEGASTADTTADKGTSGWWTTLMSPVTDPESDRTRAIRALESSVRIWAPTNSSVINIQCVSAQPKLAQRIAQAWTENVLTEYLRVTRTSRSYQFFVDQEKLFRDQLQQAEEDLREAKVQAGLVSIAGQEGVLQQALAENRSRTATNQAGLSASNAKVGKLEQIIAALPEEAVAQVVTGLPRQGWDMMRDTLYKLEANEADLSSRYTEDHPRMRAMQQELVKVQKILGTQADDRSQSARGPNPIFQSLQQDLLREQASVAALDAERQALATHRGKLDTEFTDFNQASERIHGLERQVSVLESKYRAHAEKMEEARIQEALEQARISSINVLQPATFVDRPVSPKKMVALLLGLAVGVFGGACLALMAEYLRTPSITPAIAESPAH